MIVQTVTIGNIYWITLSNIRRFAARFQVTLQGKVRLYSAWDFSYSLVSVMVSFETILYIQLPWQATLAPTIFILDLKRVRSSYHFFDWRQKARMILVAILLALRYLFHVNFGSTQHFAVLGYHLRSYALCWLLLLLLPLPGFVVQLAMLGRCEQSTWIF